MGGLLGGVLEDSWTKCTRQMLRCRSSFQMPYRETHRILFRLEAFNATNTPQWSKPGTTLETSTFGIVTSAGANRVVQAALKYSF